ncbi:Peptidoglycan-binding domain protein [Mycena venus]|uniref:Peptidoglycan-binding domain protein n=1 Tax=Mycena venus TaxID=2733690 RepID=A0A8H7CR53_9AGAR|nr:Peptidoglycan-binding domain protein [Mycena venus]
MGRWTQYDSDSTRLPEGMERIGYDSDTGRYYFRDRGGSVWQGAQGAEFSEMTRVSGGEGAGNSSSSYPPDEDIEAAPRRADGYQALPTDTNGRTYITSNAAAYRTLFPFFLLIGVVLLLIWRLILSPGLTAPKNPCPADTTKYLVEPGDSCWEISHTRGCSLDDFKKLNSKINCDALMPGSTVCIPNQPSGT